MSDFEYLYIDALDGDIIERMGAVKAMADYIRTERPEIASELDFLVSRYQQVKAEIDDRAYKLADIMKAVDKKCGSDWGIERVDEAWMAYCVTRADE